MKKVFILLVGMACALAGVAKPIKVIFDTDTITDFDDVGALACLHALAGTASTASCFSTIQAASSMPTPTIRRAVERRFGVPCVIPDVAEMAAYGAAIATAHSIEWPKRGHQRHVWLLKLKNI